MTVKQPRLESELAELKSRIATLEGRQVARADEIGPELAAWEREQKPRETAPPVDPTDLVVHLALDENQGQAAANLVGGVSHGEIHGDADWDTGKLGGALKFNGKTFIDLGDVCGIERTDAISYGAWVFAEGAGALIARMDDAAGYRGFDVYLPGDNRPEVHLIHAWPDNAIHLKAKEALPPGEWRHLFVTYDGSSKAAGVALFVDGKPAAVDVTHDALSESIHTEKPLHVARRNPSGFFTGRLDEVRIYRRRLSDAEVASLASADAISPILAIAPQERTEQQQKLIRTYFLEHHDDEYRELARQLADLRSQAEDVAQRGLRHRDGDARDG